MPSVVVIDTHALIHDALEPARLSAKARRAFAGEYGPLAACDISLWEIAMLLSKERLPAVPDALQFVEDIVEARAIQVLPITPKIAVLAQSDEFEHGDPADRIIAATAIVHGAQLVTADARLKRMPGLRVLW